MSSGSKNANLKDKLKLALDSTFKVISDDLRIDNKNKSSKRFVSYELDNLNTKNDFIKARAESDSMALKKKFSSDEIYKKNLPLNSSCKSLYAIAEKIRYESLGGKMLKGIKKNFNDNYNQIISLKRKDQLKNKDDVTINEAFELYMLKEFHDIKLNSLTNKMLSFWENELNQSIGKHMDFLKRNLENQNNYSSKFLEIFKQMDIFQNEDNEETKRENQDEDQNNPSNQDQESENEETDEKKKDEENKTSLDSEYNIDEYKLDEQLVDTD